MENSMIPRGIVTVVKATTADGEGNYERALSLYHDALRRFTLGVKYEKNAERKKFILDYTQDFKNRAEELAGYVKKQNEIDKGGGGRGTASKAKRDGDNGGGDANKKKLRGALSAIVSEKPNIKWDDVVGLEDAKKSLKETVIMPTLFPQFFTGKRKPLKGTLLYGPPGTGKSYIAKAIATEADATFFSVSFADLIYVWQGEADRLVAQLFEMAHESAGSPGDHAIIFIDEVDSLCGSRSRSEGESDSLRRVKKEFLVQMDGVGSADGQVLVLGATNIPWELDGAIRRHFEKRIYIPLPETKARTDMVRLHLGDIPNDLTESDFDRLGGITEGASGSNIKVLVKEALMEPLRRCLQAQQFYIDKKGDYHPCDKYPNCSLCPMELSSDKPGKDYTCSNCKAKRMKLLKVPPENLKPPMVKCGDFEKAIHNSVSAVSPEELKHFTDWTKRFGKDGA